VLLDGVQDFGVAEPPLAVANTLLFDAGPLVAKLADGIGAFL